MMTCFGDKEVREVSLVTCGTFRIYGMADFQGSLWQSDDYRTHSELLDPAMVEQLRAARGDSATSSTRRHHSVRGLWTSSHPHHGKGHRTSAQETSPAGPPHTAFSTAAVHGGIREDRVSAAPRRPPTPPSVHSLEATPSSSACA